VIEARLLSVWDGLVGFAAIVAITVLAFCVTVSAVKPGDVLRHLGMIVSVVILLIMLPAIIAGLWSAISIGERLGMIVLCVAIVILLGSRRRPTGVRRR
jgi:hypothetical protein